jgi:hypothetical protein
VVLDLGAGVGALILYTPAGMDGEEIEISRPGHKRTHSRVRRRDTAAGTVYAAVYPGLPEGDYAIWRHDDSQAAAATISGGSVTSCHWPNPADSTDSPG